METDFGIYPASAEAQTTAAIQQEGDHQRHLLLGSQRLHLEDVAQGDALLAVGLLLLCPLAKRGRLAENPRLPAQPRAGETR